MNSLHLILIPNIYRKSATEKLKVPPTWSNFATPDEAEPLPKPNSLNIDGGKDTDENFDDLDQKIPKYQISLIKIMLL